MRIIHLITALLVLAAVSSCSKKPVGPKPPEPISPGDFNIVAIWEVIYAEGALDPQGNPHEEMDSTNGMFALYENGTYEFFFIAEPYYNERWLGSYSVSWDTLSIESGITEYFPQRIIIETYSDHFSCLDSDGDSWTFRLMRRPSATPVPTVNTGELSGVGRRSAQCGGTVSLGGGSTVTARGVCWSTNPTPTVADDKTTDGSGMGSFTSSIAGLAPGTTYYARAYATNSVGTGYGGMRAFATESGPQTGTVTDIDGNTYQTVKIGNQWWMAENLKVTRYRNGDTLANVISEYTWAGLITGARCDYNNDSNNTITYGRLYNGYAVTDSRNIAPAGWHVPTDAEWQILIDYLGGDSIAGGIMKEEGTSHWRNPNYGATDESGFHALPGGYRFGWGPFSGMGLEADFWSSSSCGGDCFRTRTLEGYRMPVYRTSARPIVGFSVRCVKD